MTIMLPPEMIIFAEMLGAVVLLLLLIALNHDDDSFGW